MLTDVARTRYLTSLKTYIFYLIAYNRSDDDISSKSVIHLVNILLAFDGSAIPGLIFTTHHLEPILQRMDVAGKDSAMDENARKAAYLSIVHDFPFLCFDAHAKVNRFHVFWDVFHLLAFVMDDLVVMRHKFNLADIIRHQYCSNDVIMNAYTLLGCPTCVNHFFVIRGFFAATFEEMIINLKFEQVLQSIALRDGLPFVETDPVDSDAVTSSAPRFVQYQCARAMFDLHNNVNKYRIVQQLPDTLKPESLDKVRAAFESQSKTLLHWDDYAADTFLKYPSEK